MSHEIEKKADGTYSMVSGRGMTPWHGVGNVEQGLMTSRQALVKSGCDWTVSQRPLYAAIPRQGGGPKMVKVPDKVAIVRDSDDKTLGVVGGDYVICQNEDAFDFLDSLIDDGEAKFDTAGSLFGGKRVFVSILIPESHKVVGDTFDTYVMLSNDHTGTRGITAVVTKVRTVCKNTEQMAIQQAKHTWVIHHRTSMEGKLQEARTQLQLVAKYDEAFEATMEAMIKKQITDDIFTEMMKDVFPDQVRQQEANIKAVLENRHDSVTIEDEVRGTALGAYHAFTEWQDHGREYRTPDARMKHLLLGDGNKYRNNIGKLLVAASK